MSPPGTRTVHCLVRGVVQGVWFRQSTTDQARMRGLAGWVRNLEDGRVEVWLQGEAEAVEAVLAWLRTGGPPSATVETVESTDSPHDASLPEPFELRR